MVGKPATRDRASAVSFMEGREAAAMRTTSMTGRRFSFAAPRNRSWVTPDSGRHAVSSLSESIQSGRSRQRSVPQEVDHLLVSRTFRDFLEWISPDDQYAGFTIDMTQASFRRNDVLESG